MALPQLLRLSIEKKLADYRMSLWYTQRVLTPLSFRKNCELWFNKMVGKRLAPFIGSNSSD